MFAAVTIATISDPGFTRKLATGVAALDESGRSSTSQSSAVPSSSSGDDDLDTLTTIGESLAIDVSTEGLRRRATRSLKALQSPTGTTTPQQTNAIGFFKAFLALPIRQTKELENARTVLQVLDDEFQQAAESFNSNTRIQDALDDIDRFLTRYFDQYALTDQHATKEDVLLARDFERLDKTPLKIAVLEQVVRDRHNQIAFLIASLPDPIDSYTGWQFDPMLDAITQAIGASDYVLDRFHFPDSDKEETSASPSKAEHGRLHELEPGVVIFRKHVEIEERADSTPVQKDDPNSKPTYGDRLVLLLVHENPAGGIHARALANAVRLVVGCRSLTEPDSSKTDAKKPPPTIRILGPTFSGSSETLNRALHMVESRLAGYDVRVVSGSATDPQNKKTIESGLSGVTDPANKTATGNGTSHDKAKVRVTFNATVHADDALLSHLVNQITGTEWSRRIAVLFEANTQYGRQLWEVLSSLHDDRRTPLEYIQLPFAMNVSRLRTTLNAQDAAHAGPLGLPSRFRPVPMEAEGNPSDQIPQFNPKTTATYVELALAGMLETMHRERVKTVALMATDPRDKLFLAQQIARYSPDVSIFTAESDSLYIHPDYSSYLRGALVVSTYPLYSGNQRWSYGYQGNSERRQFANGSAQGIYNAALALLNYDKNGHPIDTKAPRLLEYGLPGHNCLESCQPPVWISVVGRSSAWPIRAYPVTGNSDYIFKVTSPALVLAPAIFPSPLFHALLILLTFAILVGWATQGIGGFRAPAGAQRSSRRINEGDPQQRAYLIICLTGALLIQTFVWVLCLIRVRIEHGGGWAIMTLVVASVGLAAACHMTARVLAAIVREDVQVAWRHVSWRRISTWGAIAAVLVSVWSVWNLTLYLRDYAVLDPSAVVSFVARALDFGNGVSPTLPVLFLGSALTLWGLTELSRVRRGHVALTDTAVHPLLLEMVYADVQKLKSPWDHLNRSILSVPAGGIAIAAFAFVATCIFAFDPFESWLVTIEGPRFGRFVSATLLLVQVMLTLALVQFAFLWGRIKELLDLMARHHLADAYKRVPRELFPTDLFPNTPRLVDLQIPVAHWKRLVDTPSPAAPHVGGAPAACVNLEKRFQHEMLTEPDKPWATSDTWKALLNAASYTAGRLRTEPTLGLAGAVPPQQSQPDATYKAATVVEVTALRTVVQREEELPAMLVSFVVKDALARLAYNLIFVIGGVVLVFCSHTLFPFQQHTDLQVLGWIYIGVTFTTILTVLVQMKRNEIVASLTSTTPGTRSTWDGAFVLKVTVFALLPLLALFAAQFPDIGSLILRWMEPVQQALP